MPQAATSLVLSRVGLKTHATRIRRLAIVNRGEAAMRCLRTVKALQARDNDEGEMEAVVLYTEADRDAPFVRHADLAVPLEAPNGPLAAYLDHDRIFAALRAADADAIWPGWGFVSEDPRFADRAAAEGICFLGPSAASMRLLGDKIAAKKLAEKMAVPVIEWSGRALKGQRDALRLADELGYPLMLKAAAGGGGRGIRTIAGRADLAAALCSAAKEARTAFGDGRLFLERRIASARHIEVQVAGDRSGHVRALGSRDCSAQRRHQKVLEEAPPPGLGPLLADAISQAAVRIAAAAEYHGVGTVEFLLAGEDLYFLEMNPRLQVEHGVTEAITGLDLVELQIQIALGKSIAGLSLIQRGSAIEARICAEDPDAGFLPAPGVVARFDAALGPEIRVDSGVVVGTAISPAFDSLIAKVIATGETREAARARLCVALEGMDLMIEGGATNKGYLLDCLRSEAFRNGPVDTGWLDRERERRTVSRLTDRDAPDALVAAAIVAYRSARDAERQHFYRDTAHIEPSRVPSSRGRQIDLTFGGVPYQLVVYSLGAGRYRVCLDEGSATATLHPADKHTAQITVRERTRRLLYNAVDGVLRLELDSRPYRFSSQAAGHLRAEMPAIVVALHVEIGQAVRAGDTLAILEAMKLEVALRAPIDGTVDSIAVRKGQQVRPGDDLCRIEPCEATCSEHSPRVRLETEQQPPPGIEKARGELREILLGFDVEPCRAAALLTRLESPVARRLSRAERDAETGLRSEVVAFADIERLFARAPRRLSAGEAGTSSHERLRMYVRRLHAGGTGIDEQFLDQMRRALRHYGMRSLEPSESLERAVIRLLATRHFRALRYRLATATIRRLGTLCAAHAQLRKDTELAEALARIASLRRLVSDALADTAIEVRHTIYDEPQLRGRLPRMIELCETDDSLGVHLRRLERFALDEIRGFAGLRCFHARSRDLPEDERIFVFAAVRGERAPDGRLTPAHLASFEATFHRAAAALRAILVARDPLRRLHWNRITLDVEPEVALDRGTVERVSRALAPAVLHLGLERVIVRLRLLDAGSLVGPAREVEIVVHDMLGARRVIDWREPRDAPIEPATPHERKLAAAHRRGLFDPYEVAGLLRGNFQELDLAVDPGGTTKLVSIDRPPGGNECSVVVGLVSTPTRKIPEGMERIVILSDPGIGMGALSAAECERIVAAMDLADERRLPVEWVPVSSGARIAMQSGTENLDATATVVRRIVRFTQAGGVIHVIVHGVSVGAQSYWNALSTMLVHTRGTLIMTPRGSMVLTGRAALEASGGVAAEDEIAIGGFEHIAGPNGQAQYYTPNLIAAIDLLYEHYDYTYVVPGERKPRRLDTTDADDRDVTVYPYHGEPSDGFRTVGDIFDERVNPGRKCPFAMRAIMRALVDQDGGSLERWRSWEGAQTALVWDAHLGGVPICLIGIESRSLPREGYRPLDGPGEWTGGTLFPQSSRKIARALNAASGNRPVVVLANLSGFDGSPESLRRLQLEHGAEIGRAVVNFAGPLVFLVVSRYHGGAYVVFSRELNPNLHVAALEGSYASVIGGSAAASVVFGRAARARAMATPAIRRMRELLREPSCSEESTAVDRALDEATIDAKAEIAAEFDAIHCVERARRVGSLHDIIPPSQMRPYLIRQVGGAD